MMALRTLLLGLLLGGGLLACTPYTPEYPITPTPLQNGLWLPDSPATAEPLIWLVDAPNQAVIPVTDAVYTGQHPVRLDSSGSWTAPAFEKRFSFASSKLYVADKGTAHTYRFAFAKTAFYWPVVVLDDLMLLLERTGKWRVEGSTRQLVFYTPVCPLELYHKGQAFYKEALVFEEASNAQKAPSSYRQRLFLHYHAGILYFFVNSETDAPLERYAVETISPKQWTLRSLTPPYPTVRWTSIERPSEQLLQLVEEHEQTLKRERKAGAADCP